MLTKVRRVGSSLGVLLPGEVCRAGGLGEGDRLFVGLRDGDLVLSRGPMEPGLAGFLRRVRPMFGKDVLKCYLFGSYAMGGFRPGKSDIDIYILAKRGRGRKVWDAVRRIAFNIEMSTGGAPLGPVVVDEADFDEGWFDYEVRPGIPVYDPSLRESPR